MRFWERGWILMVEADDDTSALCLLIKRQARSNPDTVRYHCQNQVIYLYISTN